jgi:hypothetical protein
MQLPLQIVRLADQRVNRLGRTRDISSGGVCFLSASALESGSRIEYLITLSGTKPPVRIRCLGKVLRCRQLDVSPQSAESDTPFEIAITMDRYQFVRSEELEPQALAV